MTSCLLKIYAARLTAIVFYLTVCAGINVPIQAQQQIPSTKFEAIAWLEKANNTVKKNEDGDVISIVIDYVPDVFVVGDLDIFSKLETLKINYTGSFYDRHMSGIARLKSLKVFDVDYCDEISESSLSVLRYLPHLEEVRLRNCEAIFSLTSLIDCTGLKKIDLSYNEHFDFDALQDLARFKKLESLTLSDNSTLEDKHLRWIGQSSLLQEVRIAGCTGITDDGIRQLSGLKKLKILDLSQNSKISGETLDSISGEHLEELYLASCGLTDETLAGLSHFKSLKKIVVFGNEEIEGEGLAVLGSFKNLESLDLTGMEVTNDHLQGLAGIKSLEKIKLSECTRISESGLAALTQSIGLKSLNLSGCRRVGVRSMVEIAKFKNLETLDLSSTRIKPEGLKLFAEMQKLEDLDLSNCNFIDDESLKTVATFKALKKLRLYEIHRLTDEGIRNLAKSNSLEELTVSRNKNITMSGLSEFRSDGPLKGLDIETLPKLSASGLRNCKRLSGLKALHIIQRKVSSELLNSLKGIPNLKDLEVTGEMDVQVYQQLRDSLPSLVVEDE